MQLFRKLRIFCNREREISGGLGQEVQNQTALGKISRCLAEGEELLGILESAPSAATDDHLRELVRQARNLVFGSAIKTFVSTMDTNHNKHGTISGQEYAQISPLLNRWRSCCDAELIDETIFHDFRTDLADFSRDCPDFFHDVSVLDWFEQDLWNKAFRAQYDRASSLCQGALRLIERRAGRIQELIDTDYASLSPFEFEHLVAEVFSRMGYEVLVTTESGDYGVDVVAKSATGTVAIQAKRYSRGNNVGNREVQMLLGAMQQKSVRATKSVLVTTSDFTVQAREQAKECPIELWDGAYLNELVHKYLIKRTGQI